MFELFDIVKLKEDRPDLGIKTNFLGTVIDVLDDGTVYTVEFIDENNETIDESIFTYFYESELVRVTEIVIKAEDSYYDGVPQRLYDMSPEELDEALARELKREKLMVLEECEGTKRRSAKKR